MAVLLALLSASCYGTSDFLAGVASRKCDSRVVTAAAQGLGVLTAIAGLVVFYGVGPRAGALEWGALSGVGGAVGTLSLYRGLAVARMGSVATVSAVLAAVIPVLVGLALGNRLGVGVAVGIGIAIPAMAMVSWQPRRSAQDAAGMLYGALSGLGFALLFIALDRAGTRSGAWPLLPGQAISLILVLPVARRGLHVAGVPSRRVGGLIVVTGVLSGVATLLFLGATGHGELAIVAVLASLYPAMTVLLARVLLKERWTRLQAVGLLMAAVAIALVTT